MNILRKKKIVEKIQVSLKSDNNSGTSHEHHCMFLITSRSVLLRMRNVSHKSCRGNQTTHFLLSKLLFSKNMLFFWIMWKKKTIVDWSRAHMTIWRMRIACWITKITHTLGMCNTYCFSTATMFARTRLNVTFVRTFVWVVYVYILVYYCIYVLSYYQ